MRSTPGPAHLRRLFFSLLLFPVLLTAGPLPPGGDFTLRGESPVRLSDYRGKVVAVYFGYTSCADICPAALSKIAGAFRQLSPDDQKRVHAIFITVDPERDTERVVANYARAFGPNFTGATGSADEIKRIAQNYGAQFRRAPIKGALGYAVDHSDAVCLLGPDGRLVHVLKHGSTTREILEAIRTTLRNPP